VSNFSYLTCLADRIQFDIVRIRQCENGYIGEANVTYFIKGFGVGMTLPCIHIFNLNAKKQIGKFEEWWKIQNVWIMRKLFELTL
tara:strand:- start:3416 stop:3670 length:255 start_codon:yes stop_codon:yes gene_type:complete